MLLLLLVIWVMGLVATKELYGLGGWGLYLLGSIIFFGWTWLKMRGL